MAEWIYDRGGQAAAIHDDDCLRDRSGRVAAWLSRGSIYSLRGEHIGWYEEGVFRDASNRVLGFTAGATGPLPSRPGRGGRPGMPGFAGRPGRPGLAGRPGRPGRGGWSAHGLAAYLEGAE